MSKTYKSYWNTPKAKLLELCVEREICFEEEPSQKEIILALFDHDKEHGTIEEVLEEDEDGVAEEVKRKREELITVIFHNKDEQDIPYVFIGLNGRSWYIPKDKEVTIPKILITSIIKDAVEVRITPRKNRLGKIVWEEKKVQRFPYSVVDL
jgi:hypothetical protein